MACVLFQESGEFQEDGSHDHGTGGKRDLGEPQACFRGLIMRQSGHRSLFHVAHDVERPSLIVMEAAGQRDITKSSVALSDSGIYEGQADDVTDLQRVPSSDIHRMPSN